MKYTIGIIVLVTLLVFCGCTPNEPTDGDVDYDIESDGENVGESDLDADKDNNNPDGDKNETDFDYEAEIEEENEADHDEEIEVEIDGDEEIEDETIATGSVSGTAKLLNADDHSGIDILLMRGSAIIQQAETDSSGNYELLEVETGVYSIIASWGDFTVEYYVTTEVDVSANQNNIADDLNLTPTGNIEGTAILEGVINGNEGIQIYLAGFSYMARTDDAGNYLISHVPVGIYKLCTDMIGYDKECLDSVEVLAGQTITEPDLDLEKADDPYLPYASLTGNVTLAGESDHGGITVSLAGTDLSTTTNASGDYSLQYIPQGKYDIVFDSPIGSDFESGATLYNKRFFGGFDEVYTDVQLNYGRRMFETDSFSFKDTQYSQELQLAVFLTSDDVIMLFDNNTGEITTLGEGYSRIEAVNPDWTTIVVSKTEGTDQGLYFLPIGVGVPALIYLPTNNGYKISKDVQTVVYKNSSEKSLYSIPTTGGEPVNLSNYDGYDIRNLTISNNSVIVTYIEEHDISVWPDGYDYTNDKLYSVPIEGGNPVLITTNVKSSQISPDSTKIVYRNGQNYLYSVPIEGGEPVSLGLCPLSYFISYDSTKVVFKSDSNTFVVDINGGTPVTIYDEIPYSFPVVTDWRVHYDDNDNGLYSVHKDSGDTVLLGTIRDSSMYTTSTNGEYVIYQAYEGGLNRIGVDGSNGKLLGDIPFPGGSRVFPAYDDFSTVLYISYFAKEIYSLNIAEFANIKTEEEEIEAEFDEEIEVNIYDDGETEYQPLDTGSIKGTAKLLGIDDHSGINILLIQDNEIIQQTETDSFGNYEFSGIESGVYSITASWGDFTEEYFATTEVDVFANKNSIANELNLTPTGNVGGVAILEGALSGNEGIQIYLSGFSYMARSDDAGNYLISNVPVGTYRLCTDMIGYEKECIDSVEVLSGQTVTVPVLDLEKADEPYLAFTSLSGNVTLLRESDHSGITISLAGTDLSTTTDSSGDYLLQYIPQGEYDVVYDSPAGSGFVYGVTLHDKRFYAGMDEFYGEALLNYGRYLLGVHSHSLEYTRYNQELQLAMFTSRFEEEQIMLFDNATGEITTVAEGRYHYPAVSPDWSTVVGFKLENISGMYSMPTDGSGPILIGPDVYPSNNCKISKDNQMVVYEDNGGNLVSIPLSGGTSNYLHHCWLCSYNFIISDNSERVVYTNTSDDPGQERGLYSVPIEGGDSVFISSTFKTFKVSSDSTRIVYLTGHKLYSVPIEGGDSILFDSDVSQIELSPDSAYIVYRTFDNGLYSVPIEGGEQVYLGLCSLSYYISLDSTKVVFKNDSDKFLIDIEGGTAITIDDESPYTDTVISDWTLSYKLSDYELYSTHRYTGDTVLLATNISHSMYKLSTNAEYVVCLTQNGELFRIGTDGNNRTTLADLGDISSLNDELFFPAFDDFSAVLYISYFAKKGLIINVAEFDNIAAKTEGSEEDAEADLDEEIEVEIDGDQEVEDETIATGSISGKAKLLNVDDYSGIEIMLMQGSTIIQQTTTDSSGNYEFLEVETGIYSIAASWGDFTEEYFATTEVDVLANQNSIVDELNLTPTGDIEGTAILEGTISGNEGIQIYLAGYSYMARTDEAGNYLISHVPVGTYKLCTDMIGYEKECIDSVEVLSGQTVTVSDLDLEQGDHPYLSFASLSGNVTLAGESDHSGITVSLTGTDLSTTTNSSGDYLMQYIPQGEYDVVYDSPAGSGFVDGATLYDKRFYAGMAEVFLDLYLGYGRKILDSRNFSFVDKLYNQELQLAISLTGDSAIRLFDNNTGKISIVDEGYGKDYSEIVAVRQDWSTIVALNTGSINSELYFLPIDGGASTSVVLPDKWSLKVSKDNQMIVYRHPAGLYSVPTTGGEPVYLGSGWPRSSIYSFYISENSETVVYEGEDDKIYSVPIAGGSSVLIDSNIKGYPGLSSDSTRIIYRKPPETSSYDYGSDLFSVPIAGGDHVLLDTNTRNYIISSDSSRIIYLKYSGSSDYDLYSVPIAGGDSVLIDSDIKNYVVGSDSTRIVYSTTDKNLYSVPIEGGEAILLDSDNYEFKVSPDSTRIVYMRSNYDLYSIPVEGGTRVYLGSCYNTFYISANSTKVVFSDHSDKFLVNIDGGSAVLIDYERPYTNPVVSDWTLFYRDSKLYSVYKDGGDPVLLATNIESSLYKLSANAEYVMYLTRDGELFRVGTNGNNRMTLADFGDVYNFGDTSFFPLFDDFSTVLYLSVFGNEVSHLNIAEFD